MSSISERVLSQQQYRSRIVEDKDLARALDFLRDSADAIGHARGEVVRTGRMVEHVEALLITASTASSDVKRKADARTNQRWIDAVNAEVAAVHELEKLRALREAATMKIEAWRTEQANYRGMKV